MVVLAHAGADEMVYVFLPALVFAVVYRLVKGKPQPPEEEDPGVADPDPASPTSPR